MKNDFARHEIILTPDPVHKDIHYFGGLPKGFYTTAYLELIAVTINEYLKEQE